jgi:hypothetical protein
MTPRATILEILSTGDIIDRSIRIYRRNLRALLATVAGPFLLGAASWLLMWFGFAALNPENESSLPWGAAVAMLLIGLLLSIAYSYLMLLAVAGLSRTVGDYVMLGEPITARAAVRAVRARLGTLTAATLLAFLAGIVGAMIVLAVLGIVVAALSFVLALVMTAGLPAAVVGAIVFIVVFVAFAAVVLVVVPILLSRIVFIPQAVMIEGCGAFEALTRSISLGGGNWYRVLGVLLFSYFSSISLAFGVMMPILLVLWISGSLEFDFNTVNAIQNGVRQFSSFLVVPVWAISNTLLYFDTRVRKEGYDVDLLARRLAPPPPMAAQAAPAGFAAPGAYASPRPFAKFAPDGRCLRCGHYNLFDSRNCPGCGW